MRSKAINTLEYTGIVTLSQYIGSKKTKIAQVHNTGGTSLFEFLADCLIGEFAVAKATRPTKIMLLKRTRAPGGVNYDYEPKSGFIFLTSKPEKIYSDDTSGVSVRYSFIITKDLIESIEDFDGLGIGLYTNNNVTENELEHYAAFCEIGLTRNQVVNAALVVDWELLIANASDYTTK